MTASKPTRREQARSALVACAVLSAVSLALPTALYLLVVRSVSTHAGATVYVIPIVIAAVLGIAYAAMVLAARDGSGAALIAGVSTTLAVLGVLALIPILLLAKLDSMSGGHSMGTFAFVSLVYVAAQFGIAAAARAVAGTGKKLRASGGFQLGLALPLFGAFLFFAGFRGQGNPTNEQAIANVQVRQKVRGDLFALYACATAHRALAPSHDYPASLQALGAQGDKCLPPAVASGERGFTFEYTPRMSGADTVAGFTVRARPKAPGPDETMLTMDEHAIIQEDYVNNAYAASYRPTPPGLDMLLAMRDCEKLYRRYHHRAPSDLRTLRAFGDSSLDRGFPGACWTLRTVNSSLQWAEYTQARKLNEWTGPGYTLTFHPESASRPVTYEVRPKTWGVTGIWSYLGISPGVMYGTPEPRAATTADDAIPTCEFGAPPTGSPQCVPGNSPPPNAKLVVDSVGDARGFTVALVNAVDSTGGRTPDSTAPSRPDEPAPEFQYAISCEWVERIVFVKESSYTCHPNWQSDSVQVRAQIRNRDLTMREYTRWVQVKRAPLVMRLAAPKPVVLGEPLELRPLAVGRDTSERLDLTVHIGDAFPMELSNWLNGSALRCDATTSPSSWQCSYPVKPGTYRVTVTAKARKGDTASVTGKVVVRRPK